MQMKILWIFKKNWVLLGFLDWLTLWTFKIDMNRDNIWWCGVHFVWLPRLNLSFSCSSSTFKDFRISFGHCRLRHPPKLVLKSTIDLELLSFYNLYKSTVSFGKCRRRGKGFKESWELGLKGQFREIWRFFEDSLYDNWEWQNFWLNYQ